MAELVQVTPTLRQDAASMGTLFAFGAADVRQKYLNRTIVYYPSSVTATQPKIAAGVLSVYRADLGNWLAIPFKDITKYVVRNARAASARQVQLPAVLLANFTGKLSLGIRRPFGQGRRPQETPYTVTVPGTGTAGAYQASDLTLALNTLIGKIAADVYAGASATISGSAGSQVLIVTETNAGEQVQVLPGDGFIDVEELVPSIVRGYYSDDFRGADLLPGTLPASNIALRGVEIHYEKRIAVSDALGSGSSQADSQVSQRIVPDVVLVLFDPATGSSVTAFNALQTILDGGSSLAAYMGRNVEGSASTNELLEYDYVIKRSDAGDASAKTAAASAYATANVGGTAPVKFAYAARNSTTGFSYYGITTNSATAPTAAGTDTLKKGVFAADDDPAAS